MCERARCRRPAPQCPPPPPAVRPFAYYRLRLYSLALTSTPRLLPPQSGNQFSGTLDGVFDNFAQLTTVKLSGNALTGPLPAVLGTMQSLGQMDFLGNLMRHEGPRNSRGELLPEVRGCVRDVR